MNGNEGWRFRASRVSRRGGSIHRFGVSSIAIFNASVSITIHVTEDKATVSFIEVKVSGLLIDSFYYLFYSLLYRTCAFKRVYQ
jgi:hypothetical protein